MIYFILVISDEWWKYFITVFVDLLQCIIWCCMKTSYASLETGTGNIFFKINDQVTSNSSNFGPTSMDRTWSKSEFEQLSSDVHDLTNCSWIPNFCNSNVEIRQPSHFVEFDALTQIFPRLNRFKWSCPTDEVSTNDMSGFEVNLEAAYQLPVKCPT